MTLILPRRRFLAGLVGLVAAPAVVKASSLMKIAAPRTTVNFYEMYAREFEKMTLSREPIDGAVSYNIYRASAVETWRKLNQDSALA